MLNVLRGFSAREVKQLSALSVRIRDVDLAALRERLQLGKVLERAVSHFSHQSECLQEASKIVGLGPLSLREIMALSRTFDVPGKLLGMLASGAPGRASYKHLVALTLCDLEGKKKCLWAYKRLKRLLKDPWVSVKDLRNDVLIENMTRKGGPALPHYRPTYFLRALRRLDAAGRVSPVSLDRVQQHLRSAPPSGSGEQPQCS